MKTIPVFKLEAVPKKSLPSYTPIWNSDELEYYLWVHVPPYVGREFCLYKIEEMSEPTIEHPIQDFVHWDNGRPWFRFYTDKLNRFPGLHIYKLSLVHRRTDDVMSLFFGYVIQCDHPPKPYKYMERDGKCGCST